MRAVVFGYRDLGVAGLEALSAGGFEVAKVFTHDAGPGEDEWYRSVAAWCAERGAEVSEADPGSPGPLAEIASLRPGSLFFFDYQVPAGPEVLALAERVYLVHPSLVPAHFGPQPVVRALLAGDKRTGVSLLRLSGPGGRDKGLVARAETYIGKDDDHVGLYRKLSALAGDLLAEWLPAVREGTDQAGPLGPVPDLTPIEPRINWFGNSWDVYNQVRALTRPNPGAYTTFLGGRMIIWRAVPDDSGVGLIHAREIEVEEGRALAGASFGSLRLEEIEWRGQVYKGRRIAEALGPHWREKFE